MNQNIDILSDKIENKIFTIRGFHIMVDRDLAEIYKVETKVLNQAVKRNIERFPEVFRFQLTDDETTELVTNCDRFELLKHSSNNPFVFTEQGVAMLSAILKSDTAVAISIKIINTFVKMRHIIQDNSLIIHRLDSLETKQTQMDIKFEQVFRALENKTQIPTQGVFYNGQVFDAYELSSRIIRTAKTSIILIDNYVDESTIVHLAKKHKKVQAIILTNPLSPQLQLDIEKANQQYGKFIAKKFKKSHDRFLIIDQKEVYHLGASLKDLGKKLFAFSQLDASSVEKLLNEIKILL